MSRFLATLLGAVCTLLVRQVSFAVEQPSLSGHVPAVVSRLKPINPLPPTNRLRLVIGLPLRNQPELDELIGQLHDPATTNYHQWLTPEEFTRRFGPSEEDYQKVIGFAEGSGLKVTGVHSNRIMLNVEGPVTNVERTFHVRLNSYAHPTENRNFFAPSSEPAIDTNLPILHISGLDNYVVPHRIGPRLKPLDTNQAITAYATGSAPGGWFMGNDFRNAYVPGVTNTGVGQFIAIVDVGGPYYSKDVYMYETNAGLSTNIVVTNILLSGWTGIPVGGTVDEGEEVLDIDMAMSMAPGATIMNYEGEAHDVFNQIAIDNKARQMTLSYGFGIDSTILQIFQQFLAQGQALSQASGDGGGDPDGGTGLTGVPYSTIVGGTVLTTTKAGGPWQSDVTWGGSGGGISGYGIPNWQQGVATSGNQASAVYRNYPDVSMPGTDVFTVYKNGTVVGGTGGTSASSPLWAGFMALVNQQAAAMGKPSVGFPNPAIYAIGKGARSVYTSCFHDVISGNTGRFTAGTGYDLCTGWGTPTGSNTISALAGTGTNEFTFYLSKDALNVLRTPTNTVVSSTVVLTKMNGLSGGITLSISGLPDGVSAAFSPVTSGTTSILTLTVSNSVAVGTYRPTITGVSGVISHSETLTLTVAPPVPGATQISLASYYNRAGIWSDGRAFSGGLDGGGYSFSANLLGTFVSWNGCVFNLGPANASDVVSCGGQTIPVSGSNYTALLLLATAVQGNQLSQTITLTYSDNSTVTYTQSFSDWANPQSYAGEVLAVNTAYRDTGAGVLDTGTPVNIYGYTFALNPAKTLKSVRLPSNQYVTVFAAMFANDPITVPLTSYYNRAGMYTDGTAFTNPPTGGLDGGGAAYSATLLTGSQVWSNTPFSFGPANRTNVISAAGQVISLPSGNFYALRMLATGIQGAQGSQTFTVNYADGTSTPFVQTLSDWFSPGTISGESKAIIMGHRNSSDGSKDNRVFYLYGYSFTLNSAKTVSSLKLPNDANIIVAAISLVPNWSPAFNTSPFNLPDLIAGTPCSGSLASRTYDLNAGALSFSKVSGPAWLSVFGSGALSGTPLSPDVGSNSFVVRVSDSGGLFSTAVMNVNVIAAPPILATISQLESNAMINWTGGIAPYQVQVSTNLSTTNWDNFGDPTNSNNAIVSPTATQSYYRILGQ